MPSERESLASGPVREAARDAKACTPGGRELYRLWQRALDGGPGADGDGANAANEVDDSCGADDGTDEVGAVDDSGDDSTDDDSGAADDSSDDS